MRVVLLFFRAWFREWWALMGCASFTILGIYAAALNKSNAWVVWGSCGLGAAFFFVASCRVWAREHETRMRAEDRLEPKAVIRNLACRVWPIGQAGISVTGKEYYFEVFNSSGADALEGVRVEVAALEPDVIGFPNPPLHIRNDDYNTREFRINPRHVRQVDLITGPVNAPYSQACMVIPHTVKSHLVRMENGKYEITVRVSCNNSPLVTATFIAMVDKKGELQCIMRQG
jgi:hypothetical protein